MPVCGVLRALARELLFLGGEEGEGAEDGDSRGVAEGRGFEDGEEGEERGGADEDVALLVVELCFCLDGCGGG